MIGHQNVELPEVPHGLGHQRTGGFRSFQVGSDGMANRRATFFGQRFCLRAGTSITESDFGASGGEHANRGRADSARTTRNQSDSTRQGKRNGHGTLVSSFCCPLASRNSMATHNSYLFDSYHGMLESYQASLRLRRIM